MTLPPYETIGDDSGAVIAIMERLFEPPAWMDDVHDTWKSSSYRNGDGENTGAKFEGAAVAPTGEVVFAPFFADHVGIYDPETDR